MKLRRIIPFVIVAVALAVAWRYLPINRSKGEKAAGKGEGGKAVAVTMVATATRDVPIWLSGLGTVQAFNKVTIRPRVSGALDEISFTEGQTVKEGDILARIDPRPYQSLIDAAEAKIAQSSSQLANARRDLERTNGLVKSGAESRQRLDLLESNVTQLVAQQQADTAAREAAQLNLGFTVVKAPIAGKTGVRMIDRGNLVTANQEGGLVVISQLQPISVVFTLPQGNLPAIRASMSRGDSLITQVVTDGGLTLAEGKLSLIDNEIDQSSGTLKLKATFPNTDEALWPGQFLTARILVETRDQAVVVPTQVISSGLDGPFAYVLKSDKTVEARKVRPGPRVDEITIIEEGLKPGEQVVLDGQSKLQPGARVTIQPAMP
jgi:multidrug efflux system membrane fusion protein